MKAQPEGDIGAAAGLTVTLCVRFVEQSSNFTFFHLI